MRKMLHFLVDPILNLKNYPILYKGNNFNIVNFGLFAALNVYIIITILYFYMMSKGVKLHYPAGLWIVFISLCTILFAKILHPFVIGLRSFSIKKHFRETAMYNQGGEFGAILALLTLSYVENLNLVLVLDGACLAAPLGLFFGRLGCYSYGCCSGKVKMNEGFSTIYTNPNAKILRVKPELVNTPLFPIQLYTSLFNLVLFILLLILVKIGVWNGFIVLTYLVLYNGFRVLTEGYRNTENSIYTKISWGYIIIGTVLWILTLANPSWQTYTPTIIPFTLDNYIEITIFNMKVLPWSLLVFFISFIYYGVHGKKLGQHF